ncbi:hypothetical protein ES288_D06G016600v1 [Gossypium darwinii]|uniref:Cytochrome P450 n=1 Tax=Gossypium darwinii TaxID=34276 RepID=A0A5D2C3L6_GOSDA|nr:hypothetical protein ES288_D06G016600v1 [Gossypium darwinii]
MDSFHSTPTPSTLVIIAFPLLLVFLFFFLWISKSNPTNINNGKLAPEAGGAWPIIGHLRVLRGPQPPHISLGNMAEKYGRMFTIKLGVHRALVVTFATRPKLAAWEILGYNNSMIAAAPYGPFWPQVRKFATVELLSNHRLDLMKHVRKSAIKTSMQELYQLWNTKKSNVTLNMILRVVVGKRIPNSYEGAETLKWRKSLDDFCELGKKFVLLDALPFLRWLDIGGEDKLMKKMHKENRAENKANSDEDFMGVMLSILHDAEEHDADTINEGTSLALILAAEDTTSITLTWALSLLFYNLTESDTKNLVYLQSSLKKHYIYTLLFHFRVSIKPLKIVPLMIVSAGTWLIFNL